MIVNKLKMVLKWEKKTLALLFALWNDINCCCVDKIPVGQLSLTVEQTSETGVALYLLYKKNKQISNQDIYL